MTLQEGNGGSRYKVRKLDLPVELERRLEALGLIEGTTVTVMRKKRRGAGYFFAFPRRRPLPAVSEPLLCNRKRAGACPLLRFTSARPFCLRCRCSFG